MAGRIEDYRSDEHFGDGEAAMRVMRMRPQPDCELHRHEFVELVLVEAGGGRHLLDEAAYPLAPGDVFVVLPGMVHGYDRCHRLQLINILYEPRRLELPRADIAHVPGYHALFTLEPRLRGEQAFGGRLHLDQPGQAELQGLVDGLERELREAAGGAGFAALAWLMQIILWLSRRYDDRSSSSGRDLLGLADVLTHMERHYDDELGVDELAAVAGVSVSTLQRLFRRALDATPVEHLNALRVRRACELLRDSRASISRVAGAVGIPDSNYFARVFRREMGCSPREFRSRMLELAVDGHRQRMPEVDRPER